MNIKITRLIYGLLTYVPGVYRLFSMTYGGTVCAEVCYFRWLRHITSIYQSNVPFPKTVAELGPGNTLGIGIAALISGVDKYYALDVIKHPYMNMNIEIFDKLVPMFQNKIDAQHPWTSHKIPFPKSIFTNKHLKKALEPKRLKKIRQAITDNSKHNIIHFYVPWNDSIIIKKETVDIIYSDAVLEHVDDLDLTYKAMFSWLKPKAIMSHAIDFKSHGSTNEWNGHWACPNIMWKILKGNRPYFINRQPYSKHIELLIKNNFEIVSAEKIIGKSNITLNNCVSRFKTLTEEDLTLQFATIQAIKA